MMSPETLTVEKLPSRVKTALAELKEALAAIYRLYYSMFYAAETLLYAKGYSFSSHKGVISAFGQHFVKTKILPLELHQWL